MDGCLFSVRSFISFPLVVGLLLLAALPAASPVTQAGSYNFSFEHFSASDYGALLVDAPAAISNNALQLTPDSAAEFYVQNRSGRVFYSRPFKLWDRKTGMKASFISNFVMSIYPVQSKGGDGLAFILSKDSSLPNNSAGQWLGIMNASTVGLPRNIVAVEFDTMKSYQEDLDDNHVGVDVNSIYSLKQEPLAPHGVNLSNPAFIHVRVLYDPTIRTMSIFAKQQSGSTELLVLPSYAGPSDRPVLEVELDLSEYLPEEVYVGFSASTWANVQLNCILSWNFTSLEIISKKDRVNLYGIWIYILLASLTLLVAIFCLLYWKRNQQNKKMQDDPEIELEILSSSTAPQKFKLRQLRSATGNFNSTHKLGKGGFGTVYKGILSSKEVAVKRISKNSRHGKQDFIAEVKTIGNLHHKNLVKLIGWCYERSEFLLVYELMPNGSLDKFIFSSGTMPGTNDTTLSWERRHGVICGVARALDYLHYGCEKRVLHRDIKASNIMLDSEFNARLGDFGLARVIQPSENTHHSTKQIAGTPGYMAPESFHTGRATVETDVYAFGVLMLEVVSGRKPGTQNEVNNYNNSIVDWVWEHYKMERLIHVVDSTLNGNFEREQAESVLMLGLACCHPNPNERPSMRTVLQVLNGEVSPPAVPIEKPAFMWPAAMAVSATEEKAVHILSGAHLSTTTEFSGR